MFSSETIKKILVPTDGSDPSIRAAEYAISIAKTHEAEIVVVSVVDEVVVEQLTKATGRESIEHELKVDAQNAVNYVVNLAEKQGIKATSLLVKGRPYEQIVHISKGVNADIIVMGTYGRRGHERLLIGSVTERVIEYSHCPVLVVK